jgi:hypothetical protein
MNDRTPLFLTGVEVITPQMAREYLASQARNRTPNEKMVRSYAKEMAKGNWELSPQGISFDDKGSLIDGQHRMLAVVMANAPIRFIVARNVSKDAHVALDQGKVRKLHECATIAGFSASSSSLAILNVMRQVSQAELLSSWSRQDGVKSQLSLYETHQEAILFANQRYCKKNTRKVVNVIYRAIVARAYYTQDHDRLVSFLRCLDSGAFLNEGKDSAALLLRKLALNDFEAGLRARTAMVAYRKSISALKAFLEERPISYLVEAKSNPFAVKGLPD